jgi:hypothetical protein
VVCELCGTMPNVFDREDERRTAFRKILGTYLGRSFTRPKLTAKVEDGKGGQPDGFLMVDLGGSGSAAILGFECKDEVGRRMCDAAR